MPSRPGRSGIFRPVPADPKDAQFLRACLDRAAAGPPAVRESCTGLTEEDARWKPGVGKLSVIEHLQHMADMEREVFGVRIRRVLTEDNPRLDPVDQDHLVEEDRIRDRPWADVLEEWAALRAENLRVVEQTTEAEWKRPVRHPELGDKSTFADVVARWSRHDGDHLRQIEILARNCRERRAPA
jgi:hypothetical protein